MCHTGGDHKNRGFGVEIAERAGGVGEFDIRVGFFDAVGEAVKVRHGLVKVRFVGHDVEDGLFFHENLPNGEIRGDEGLPASAGGDDIVEIRKVEDCLDLVGGEVGNPHCLTEEASIEIVARFSLELGNDVLLLVGERNITRIVFIIAHEEGVGDPLVGGNSTPFDSFSLDIPLAFFFDALFDCWLFVVVPIEGLGYGCRSIRVVKLESGGIEKLGALIREPFSLLGYDFADKNRETGKLVGGTNKRFAVEIRAEVAIFTVGILLGDKFEDFSDLFEGEDIIMRDDPFCKMDHTLLLIRLFALENNTLLYFLVHGVVEFDEELLLVIDNRWFAGTLENGSDMRLRGDEIG